MFGPRLGPFFVGCALGLVSFASSGLVSRYTGAAMNPARCFAFATAKANYKGRLTKLFILKTMQDHANCLNLEISGFGGLDPLPVHYC